MINTEKKSGSAIWIGTLLFLFEIQTKMPYKMRISMILPFWKRET